MLLKLLYKSYANYQGRYVKDDVVDFTGEEGKRLLTQFPDWWEVCKDPPKEVKKPNDIAPIATKKEGELEKPESASKGKAGKKTKESFESSQGDTTVVPGEKKVTYF